MTSEKKIAKRAAQFATSDAETSCKKTTRLVAQIKTRTSNLPEEQQDKLLFEVFDMLLWNNKLSRDLSPTTVVLTRKKCKVKEKVTVAPERRATQTKACQNTQRS
jgi:hypothetical protein